MHLLYLNNEITSDYVFSVIKRDVLISNLTQVQRYPAALQTLDGSASQWYQYVYILLLSCSWYNSSRAKKHINVYVVYWRTSKSHTLHLISSSVSLFSYSQSRFCRCSIKGKPLANTRYCNAQENKLLLKEEPGPKLI